MVATADPVVDELMRVLRHTTARAVAPLTALYGLGYLIVSRSVESPLAFTWMCAAILALLLRLAGLHFLVVNENLNANTRVRITMVLTFANASIVATVLLFFPSLDAFGCALVTTILMANATGAIISTAGYRPVYLCHILPIMCGLSIMWFINPGDVAEPSLAFALGVSSLIAVPGSAVVAQVAFDSFSRSVASNEAQKALSIELNEALQAATVAQQDAERLSDSKTRFIAAASHDLRQPVHVLSLYGAVLSGRDHDPETTDILAKMAEAIDSLASELNTLLDLSKLDSQAVEPIFDGVELQALSERLLNEFSELAANKGLVLRNLVEEPVYARTDVNMLSQVLRNLIGNAIKYSPDGHVDLFVQCSPNRAGVLTLVVADTGIGIGEDKIEHVFEEFFQVGNSQRDKSLGQGLGLSIVQRLLDALGHSVTVRSVIGKGTAFRIDMPLSKPAQSAHKSAEREPSMRIDLPKGLVIHVVDDDAEVRRSMRLLLEHHDLAVVTTDTCQQTLSAVRQRKPSIMLIDMSLAANESGVELLRDVQSIYPDLPGLFVTGEATPQDMRSAGNVPILRKPVTESALLSAISELV